MVIKHLCLSGGGITGLPMYGCLKRLNILKFWDYENIKSVYSCSIGAVIGLLVILNISWDWCDDFFIKRPWKNIIDIENINYIQYILDKGFIDEKFWNIVISPLLKCKNISPDITMLELYKLTNIKFNIYTTKLIGIEPKIINYETEPNMKLVVAITVTTNIPGLSKPFLYNDNFLIDGGLLNNNPINDCSKDNDPDEILNICNDTAQDNFELDKNYTSNYKLDNYIYSHTSDNNIDFDINDNTIELDISDNTIELDISDNSIELDISDNTIELDISDNTLEFDMNDMSDMSDNTLEFDISHCENISNVDSICNTLESNIDFSCNIIEYTGILVKNLVKHIVYIHCSNEVSIENKISVGVGIALIDVKTWFTVILNALYIEKYINFGCAQAEKFYIKKCNIN